MPPDATPAVCPSVDDLSRIAFQPLRQVTLHLSGTLTIVDTPALLRIQQAIAEIDHVIADLRAAMTPTTSRPASTQGFAGLT